MEKEKRPIDKIRDTAKWERNKKCIVCGNERAKNRTICKSCHSAQVRKIRQRRLDKLNKTFNCKGCLGKFPKYRENQIRCRPCYLIHLKQIMTDKWKNK